MELDIVAPGNHKANGMAERMIRELNDRMAVKGDKEWKKWHHHIKDVEMSLRVTPCDNTGLSPAKMYLGKQLRIGISPTFQEVSMEEDNVVDSAHRTYNLRSRKIKQKQESLPETRPYGLMERVFKEGELARVFTDRTIASKSEGMPTRWKNKYGIKASIVAVLKHDQYLLRNTETGHTIKRSGAQLSKIPQY